MGILKRNFKFRGPRKKYPNKGKATPCPLLNTTPPGLPVHLKAGESLPWPEVAGKCHKVQVLAAEPHFTTRFHKRFWNLCVQIGKKKKMTKSSYEKIDCCFVTPLCKAAFYAFKDYFFKMCSHVCYIFRK